jgi:AraC-like DNA-binding protein
MYLLYRLFILGYDAAQPGFGSTQNGILMDTFDNPIFSPFYHTFIKLQLVIYLAFTVQIFYQYRQKIIQYYSNIFQLELNWLRNFLTIYILLFVYEIIENLVGSTILEMSWTHRWWYHFLAAVAIIYIGVKGYFTDTSRLNDLEFNALIPSSTHPDSPQPTTDYDKEKRIVLELFQSDKIYLNPDLSLKTLADTMGMAPGQLSEIINNGFQKNFNDFVNGYRVEEVKAQLKRGRQKELSLVGIAMDCGFNSKATFNRVFKKLTGYSPSAYLDSIS